MAWVLYSLVLYVQLQMNYTVHNNRRIMLHNYVVMDGKLGVRTPTSVPAVTKGKIFAALALHVLAS